MKIRGKKRVGPFIVSAEGANSFGEYLAIPIGIVIASREKEAMEEAKRRWPYYFLLLPDRWERVTPSRRMSALRAEDGQFAEALLRLKRRRAT